MKTLKIFAVALLSVGLSSQISAISNEHRLTLLEGAMVESAINPQQKSIVSAYMANVAKEKMELAQSLRESAKIARGGKVVTQDLKKKDLLEQADRLEKEAAQYKSVAIGLSNEAQMAKN